MAQRDRHSWPPLLVANAWTRYGTWLVLHFGLGFLLRAATNNPPEEYLGFWGWFFLVSLIAFGYGVWRYRQGDCAGNRAPADQPYRKLMAGLLGASVVLIVLFTDNSSSARMPGRYSVAVLVAAYIVLDWAVQRRRRAANGYVRQVTG